MAWCSPRQDSDCTERGPLAGWGWGECLCPRLLGAAPVQPLSAPESPAGSLVSPDAGVHRTDPGVRVQRGQTCVGNPLQAGPPPRAGGPSREDVPWETKSGRGHPRVSSRAAGWVLRGTVREGRLHRRACTGETPTPATGPPTRTSD